MSELRSALDGARGGGLVAVAEAGLRGMITLRGDLGDGGLCDVVAKAFGVEVPATGEMRHAGDRSMAWMAPDELLLMLPHAEATAMAAKLDRALKGRHRLVADVSDARATFRLEGDEARLREVLAKLTPADVSPRGWPRNRLRRSRLAQAAAAFWMGDDGAVEVICFRSAAQYVFDLLTTAAQDGGEVGYF